MWVSKQRWNELQKEIQSCYEEIYSLKENMRKDMIKVAKKILQEPDKLLEEIENQEEIEKIINDFIHS